MPSLAATGVPLECSYREPLRDDANVVVVEDQLDIRYHALSELFEMHCSEAEVAAVTRISWRIRKGRRSPLS